MDKKIKNLPFFPFFFSRIQTNQPFQTFQFQNEFEKKCVGSLADERIPVAGKDEDVWTCIVLLMATLIVLDYVLLLADSMHIKDYGVHMVRDDAYVCHFVVSCKEKCLCTSSSAFFSRQVIFQPLQTGDGS